MAAVLGAGANVVIGDARLDGGGTVVLTGANSYTTATNVFNGTLQVSSINSVVGGTATSNLGAPTTATTGTIGLGSAANAVGLTYTGLGETTDRVIALTGTTGVVTLTDSATTATPLKFTSNLSVPGVAATDQRKTLTLSGSTTNIGNFAGNIGDALLGTSGQLATSITKTGTGTWTLTGTNTYSGLTTATAGVISFNGTGALPAATTISLNGGTFQVLNDTGGTTSTVTYGNAFGALVASTVNVGNNGGSTTGSTIAFGALSSPTTSTNTGLTLTFTGSNNYNTSFTSLALPGTTGATTIITANNNVIFTGNVTNRGAGTTSNFDTLQLQGSATGSLISGVIADQTAKNITLGNYTPVSKQGTGTWTFTGANTYTGNTSISTGTLALKDITGATAASPFQVIGGSQVLAAGAGTGTLNIQGNVAIGDGTAALTATQGTLVEGGATNVYGNVSLLDTTINKFTIKGNNFVQTNANFLTLGSVTAGQASIISLDVGNTTTDTIAVNQVGTNGKLLLQLGGAVIALNQLASTSLSTANSPYTLITYPAGSTLTGAFSLSPSNIAPAGEVFTLNTTATALQLIVSAGAGSGNAYFKGSLSAGVWNAGGGTTTTNFTTDFGGTLGSAIPDSTTNVFIFNHQRDRGELGDHDAGPGLYRQQLELCRHGNPGHGGQCRYSGHPRWNASFDHQWNDNL